MYLNNYAYGVSAFVNSGIDFLNWNVLFNFGVDRNGEKCDNAQGDEVTEEHVECGLSLQES